MRIALVCLLCSLLIDIYAREFNSEMLMRKIIRDEHAPSEYYTFIGIIRKSRSEAICSGSLITTLHLLTAGHCVYKARFYCYPKYFGVYVEVGSQGPHNKNGTSHAIIHIDIHEKFHPYKKSFHDDIGLITLENPVDLNKNDVSLISLPEYDPPIGGQGESIGWATELLNESDDSITGLKYMKKMDIRFLNNDYCQLKYPDRVILSKQICLYPINDKDAFSQGDSGGPGIYRGQVVAIMSSYKKLKKYPCVATRVHSYLDYIKRAKIRGSLRRILTKERKLRRKNNFEHWK